MPKLYGRKFAHRFVDKKMKPKAETRDAIIFEVDEDYYVCKCRIQGSSEYVDAYYPRNRATIPKWMKPGNAVRILHRTGVRGYAEVIGHGGAIPMPMAGYPSHPPISGVGNHIESGLEITVVGCLTVHIGSGTVVIEGETITMTGSESGYPIMDESNPEMTMHEIYPPADMGDPAGTDYWTMNEEDSSGDAYPEAVTMSEVFAPMTIGVGGGYFDIDPLDLGGQAHFRYDTFQVGSDGIIDYVKGEESYGSAPTPPAVDGGHVQIGPYILIVGDPDGGTQCLTDANVGWVWTEPIASGVELDYNPEMQWATSYASISVNVINQYGYTYADPRTYTATLVRGTGQICTAYGGTCDDDSIVVNSSSGGAGFQYNRDYSAYPESEGQIDPTNITLETCPHIAITVTGTGGMPSWYGFAFFQLYTIGDFPIQVFGSGSWDPGSTGYNVIEPDSSGGAEFTIDWGDWKNAEIMLTQDSTLSFSGASDADKLTLLIRQNGTGGWTPSLPANVTYGDQITEANLSISTDPYSRTYLGFIYDLETDSYDLVANVSGYV